MKFVTGAVPEDVTDRISEDDSFVVTTERERGAFFRTVDDVSMTLSNIDGHFTPMFTDSTGRKTWILTIVDGEGDDRRTLFRGRITPDTTTLDVRGDYVRVQAFSDLKEFWDRTKTTRIMPNAKNDVELAMAYATVSYLLDREFIKPLRQPRGGGVAVNERYGDLFTKLVIDVDYKDRNIRAWADASTTSDPSIGDNGRFRELFGSTYNAENIRRFGSHRTAGPTVKPSSGTTAFDLLTAFAVYYNAEFYLDYDQNALVMAHRMRVSDTTPTPTGAHLIGPTLQDDQGVDIVMVESEKYDVIHVPMYQQPPPTPLLATIYPQTVGGITDDVTYAVTDVIELSDGSDFETGARAPLLVDVKAVVNTIVKGVWIQLTLPATTGVTLKRKRLYRSAPGGGDLCLLAEFNAPSGDVTYLDTGLAPLNTLVMPPVMSHAFLAWLSYDETTGKWNDPIADTQAGANTPDGKIFEAIPTLTFRALDGLTELTFDVSDTVAFFGLEARDGVVVTGGSSSDWRTHVQAQFLDIVQTRPGLKCSLAGTNYKVGDAVTYNHPSNPLAKNGGFIKRAAIDGHREETEIEAVLT